VIFKRVALMATERRRTNQVIAANPMLLVESDVADLVRERKEVLSSTIAGTCPSQGPISTPSNRAPPRLAHPRPRTQGWTQRA
jgi:hypothetical protein